MRPADGGRLAASATAPSPIGSGAFLLFRSVCPRARHARRRGGTRRSVMSEPGGAWHRTLCPYCGVGCGLLARVEEGAVTRVKGDPEHPANFGDVCAKAVHLPPLLRPHLRARRDLSPERVPWELAIRATADRIREIVAAHGPDAVAFYGSGQLLTEEYYLAAKLAKGFI